MLACVCFCHILPRLFYLIIFYQEHHQQPIAHYCRVFYSPTIIQELLNCSLLRVCITNFTQIFNNYLALHNLPHFTQTVTHTANAQNTVAQIAAESSCQFLFLIRLIHAPHSHAPYSVSTIAVIIVSIIFAPYKINNSTIISIAVAVIKNCRCCFMVTFFLFYLKISRHNSTA